MKNGYPMWKDLWEQRSLWYENGKWKVGDEIDIDYTHNDGHEVGIEYKENSCLLNS